jgi:TRAP-type C4-dicarboxylate transport system permease small subunit
MAVSDIHTLLILAFGLLIGWLSWKYVKLERQVEDAETQRLKGHNREEEEIRPAGTC